MTARKESWLARWSRRKLAEEAREAHARGQEPGPAGACTEPPEAVPTGTSADTANLAEKEPDLAALDARSDYTPFLRQDVRPEVRSAALRKLWSSDPIFSQTDGLQDYAGDFTDGATVPPEPIATAYQMGWGVAARAAVQEDGRDTPEPEQPGGPSKAGEADPKPADSAGQPQCAHAPPTGTDEPEA